MTPHPPRPADTDHLEAAVDTLAFEPALHFQARLGHPGGFAIDSDSRAPLYMAHGESLFARHPASGWEAEVRSGELLFLPRGGRHEVRSAPGAAVTEIDGLASLARGNGRRSFHIDHPAPVATLVGSIFWTQELLAQPLLARLPPVVHLRGDRCGSAEWLAPMGQLMRWMTDLRQGGGGVGMNESANALLRHVVLAQARHEDDAPPHGGPAPHRDAGLGPALRAIHTRPEEDWSIERLAALCHMSRTAFAMRFGRALREAPLRYLTRWRMTRARQLLADRRLSLDEVAQRVGYSSGYALSKAYKRETKASPRGSAATRDGGERRQAA